MAHIKINKKEETGYLSHIGYFIVSCYMKYEEYFQKVFCIVCSVMYGAYNASSAGLCSWKNVY